MNKDQQNPNDKTLLGLKKRTPSNKPKEERIIISKKYNNYYYIY